MEEIAGSLFVSPEVYWLLNKNKGNVNFRKLRTNSYCYLFKKNILQIIQFDKNNCSCYHCYYYTKKIKKFELGITIEIYEFIEPIFYA